MGVAVLAILTFEKPKKVRSTEEHNDMYSSDCGVEGTYVPNMSDEDNEKWKAKYISGEYPRIEIRKCFNDYEWKEKPPGYCRRPSGNYSSQVCINVYTDGGVVMSMNSRSGFASKDWNDLQQAVTEAKQWLITPPERTYSEEEIKAMEDKAEKARKTAENIEKKLEKIRSKNHV
jgi:molecular chaperone DnaK (HSP70)